MSRALIACVPLFGILVSYNPSGDSASHISLAGQWRFQLDREDVGIMQGWYQDRLRQNIRLPGALQAQGFGDDVDVATKWTGQIVDRSYFTDPRYEKYRQPGNIKVPFWLQPDKYYAGPAWYQRDIEIPTDWRGRSVVLSLERPHWQTLVWLDGKIIGSNDSLSTAHEYDLGTGVSPGKHGLTIRVDNRLIVDVGINSHSVSDHTQGNWNGIVGRIELMARNPVWIDDLQIYPRFPSGSITVKGRLANLSGRSGQAGLRLMAESVGAGDRTPLPASDIRVSWTSSGGKFEAEYPLGERARVWDEFTPFLYRLTAILDDGKDERTVSFGLRDISTQGTQFLVNGRKTFFRGTLECAIFPLTGHPPTDVESWRRIIRIAKTHGLNLIRFHSWCPPEAAFEAADELGFYYQVEIASWANQSTMLGVGLPIDDWLYREAERILKAYGNHPSFILMPYGNEPAGKDREFLARWVLHFRGRDPRRLYTSGSGWPQTPENQFHVAPQPRIQGWGQGLGSRINAKPPETQTDYRNYIQHYSIPVISHEIGQWCVYPDFNEIPKYRGYLKAKNFEIFRDSLAEHHMIRQAGDFLVASGKLQTLCYKE
ncbi:MAG TPA: glycoside hydrolase, partial [Acidobacteriota bacterium]|nr:glycoside hydrolase [Acidobacteriota bacterium]